ncbi:amino acid/polyamine/organocation transporter (APC superfamily) [Roseimicrobium gellanilyticum]|uniref:Amino acid/polyamine/organocation transporter (APC superfamily) n=1 Tax=Roseimicrobium gellanilyticum TaxID=748857 RepID=A0A366H867_9BACT|nr:amino acid permease [Roseimicrobium gellanilyticum]RBP37756.1 amino acid/polyamine/organocation transporter (APC superfamily) [Roseimicrobium gellanilyticum]
MPDDHSSTGPKLKQTLGFWQVALYGLGSMLGAGIYTLIGRAADSLGNAVWLAFAAAMVAALLTGLSYACVGSRCPRAAGAAYVSQRAYGRAWLTYVVGIAVMMSGLTSMGTGAQAILEQAEKFHAFRWDTEAWKSGDVRWDIKLLAIGVVFIIGSVIYRGIRESMWVNILCTIVEASGLIFILAVGIPWWGSVNYLEIPPAKSGAESILALVVLQGAVLTFYSFIGFEDILNVSEEVKDAPRNLPRGLVVAMMASTVIYMAVAITAVSVVPWEKLASSKSPLVDVAAAAAPWFANVDKVFAVVAIFAIGNTALLNYLMGSRLIYGMSAQGLLPAWIGRIHPKRRTPHVAVVVLFLIVTTLILMADVKQLAESTSLLLLMVFTVVNVALVILKRRKGEPKGKFEVPVAVPILGALVCATLIVVRVKQAFDSSNVAAQRAPLIAGVIIAIGLVLYLVLKPKHVVLDEDAVD